MSAKGRPERELLPLGGKARSAKGAPTSDAAARPPSGALLTVSRVGKDYAKVDTRGGRIRLVWDLLRGHAAAQVFRALDGVDFELQRGASLGVIGLTAGMLLGVLEL